MSEALDKLEGNLIELCPRCEGDADGCLTCADAGYILHHCPGSPPISAETEDVLRELRALDAEG